MLLDKYYIRKWPDGSEVRVSFKKDTLKILIAFNLIKNSVYEDEFYKIEQLFINRTLNKGTVDLLKKRGFSEHNYYEIQADK